jgi:hypothetical protein
MAKQVYISKGTISIDGKQVDGVKSFTLPRELGWAHEDDLNGGGVVQEVSVERTLKLTYGVPRDGEEYNFNKIERSNIIVRIAERTYQYSDCYIKSIGEPQFSGSGAATRDVEILVGGSLLK